MASYMHWDFLRNIPQASQLKIRHSNDFTYCFLDVRLFFVCEGSIPPLVNFLPELLTEICSMTCKFAEEILLSVDHPFTKDGRTAATSPSKPIFHAVGVFTVYCAQNSRNVTRFLTV